MTLQASQTVPEKSRDWVRKYQEQVADESACDREHDRLRSGDWGERGVQKFRSCGMEGDRICRDYRLEADATLCRGHADLIEERFRFWAQLSGKQCSMGFQPVSGVRCRIEQHWVTVPQKIWRRSRKNFPSCLLPMRAPWTPADEPLINSATRELLQLLTPYLTNPQWLENGQ